MIEEELLRISNMDEHQILLKARNHKHYKHLTLRDYQTLGKAINDRLSVFGYTLQPGCCGNYKLEKINE